MSVGDTGLDALDTSVECAGTVWGHVRTEMIKVATMRIKSQTRRIRFLNLSTNAQLQRGQKKKQALCLPRLRSAAEHWLDSLCCVVLIIQAKTYCKYLQHWWTLSSKTPALICISTLQRAGFQTKTNLLHHDKHADYAMARNWDSDSLCRTWQLTPALRKETNGPFSVWLLFFGFIFAYLD